MARRRKQSTSISLFPFLSILACIIGTLTLMITGLAISQMGSDEGFKQVDKYESSLKKLPDLSAMVQQLQAAVAKAQENAGSQQQAMIDLQKQLTKQLEDLIAQKNTLLTQAAPEKMTDAELQAQLTELQTEQAKKLAALDKKRKDAIAALDKQIKELEDLLEKIKELEAQLAKAPTVDPAQVKVLPSGSGVNLKPTFVECAATSIVLFDQGKETRVPRGQIRTNPAYKALIKRISDANVDEVKNKKPKSTIIFLVRDDAISTYNLARDVARTGGAQNGKLPVVGQGKLDLSACKG